MNFDFSEEQKELQAHVGRMLRDRCPPEALRGVADGEQPYVAAAWRGLAEMGCLGAAIPENYGGAGMGYLELCIIAEEVGRANAPVPVNSSIYLAAELLLLAGSEAQKAAWLPRLASGEAIGCLVRPPAKVRGAQSLRFDGARLSGAAASVVDGPIATLAVVAVSDAGSSKSGGVTLVLVDLEQAGVARSPIEGIDPTRPRAALTFDNVRAEVLGGIGGGADLLRQVTERAAILVAFEQIGGAQQCLEMARDYALTRYAFGRVIGSYQAIKHKLVDIYARNRMAIAHAYYGAWALSTGSAETPLAAASARVSASDAFNFAAQENIQTHGGIGFTWEHPCHLYYRRARALSLELGSPHEWREAIASRLDEKNAA